LVFNNDHYNRNIDIVFEQLLALIEDLTFAPLSKTAFANIKAQTNDSNSSNTMQLFLKYNELKFGYHNAGSLLFFVIFWLIIISKLSFLDFHWLKPESDVIVIFKCDSH
jgi:hypothetical protein